MKQDKIKRYTLRFGIVFFIVLAILTYFSKTIDNLLLPKVRVYEIEEGRLNEEERNINITYLVPMSAVVAEGDIGIVYITVDNEENDNITVEAVDVKIKGNDELYYEVEKMGPYLDLSGEMAVYSTSKSISDGDRVYVEE